MRVCTGRKKSVAQQGDIRAEVSRYKPLDTLASSGKCLIGAADLSPTSEGWCSFDGRLTDEILRARNSSKLKGKKRGCCLSITFAFACPS
jgi:hypothetical protein